MARRAKSTCVLVVLLASAAFSSRSAPDPLPGFLPHVQWAWEQPERLSYADPNSRALVFLVGALRWRGTGGADSGKNRSH